jgi:hypothetical protein
VTIEGTSGPDVLSGTNEIDVIPGLGGDVGMSGMRRRDFLCGGGGDNMIGDETGDSTDGGDRVNESPGNADRVDGGADYDECLMAPTTRCSTSNR